MTFSRREFLATLPAAAALGPAGMDRAPGARVNRSQEQSPAAPREKHLLATRCPPDLVRRHLLSKQDWKPYPPAADRDAWQALAPAVRARLVEDAGPDAGKDWLQLSATLFLDFVRTGNRVRYETVLRARRARLRRLVMAECVEGRGRFLDDIANGVWAICEETYWGFPAHVSLQKLGPGLPDAAEPTIDLFAAEVATLLAWTSYLLGPQLASISPRLPERIAAEVERRILAVYHDRDDFHWMGFHTPRPVNNWNPWINSNCLACVLVLEADADRRARLASKIIRSLDRFLDAYPDDGACDEGPSYWGHAGASLFEALNLLASGSNDRVDLFSIPLVQEIGRYIYRVHIADDWFVNFADASARIDIAGDIAFRYGERINDPLLQALGAWSVARAKNPHEHENLGRVLSTVFGTAAREKIDGRPPLPRDAWLKSTHVMTARIAARSAAGFYVAAQGGHNAESHNHNDVGNFIVFFDGKPLVVDAGVETYSAKTFSPQRYEIWTMQSAYHNCPTINGVMQGTGLQFAARNVEYDTNDARALLRLDLAAAYPPEAGVRTWVRTVTLDRKRNAVEVADVFRLERAANRIGLTLMTASPVRDQRAGSLVLAPGALGSPPVQVSFDAGLTPLVEEIAIEDARLASVWGPRLYRIQLHAGNVPESGRFVVRFRAA